MKDYLISLGIKAKGRILRNLEPVDLIKESLYLERARLSDTGALSVKTGKYTGRASKHRYIVANDKYHNEINWGKDNMPMESDTFNKLYDKITKYMSEKDDLFVFDGQVGADEKYSLNIRIINELPSQNLCARNMFIRLDEGDLENFKPDFIVLAAPKCIATEDDGVPGEAFICINLSKKIVVIGGTGYAGEIKKSLFSIMNFLLPKKGILPMHCAANMDNEGNTALFFGLSGTGKTTLSADENRKLIGDDEHGWSDIGIFNFEGGCYAKTINLKKEHEPQIYNAIRHGAVVENVRINEDGVFDFSDSGISENGRVSYPVDFIENAELSGVGGHPKTILFLTADTYGVLPPISKLNFEQAMYHFISGYTCKLAGTEAGVVEPKVVFSSFFGAPFMPHKPMVYANLLAENMKKYNTQVYLINTGWTGGPYGVGKRISIKDTRAMVTGAITGVLDNVEYKIHPIFNLPIPVTCSNVESSILNPINSWKDKDFYFKKANDLAKKFVANFYKFENIPQSIVDAGPKPITGNTMENVVIESMQKIVKN